MTFAADLLRSRLGSVFTLAASPLLFSLRGTGSLFFCGGPQVTLRHRNVRHVIGPGDWKTSESPSPRKTKAGERFHLKAACPWLAMDFSLLLDEDASLLAEMRLTPLLSGISLEEACPFFPASPETAMGLSSQAWVYDLGYQSWAFGGKRPLYGPGLNPVLPVIRTASYNEAIKYTGKPGHHFLHWMGAVGDPALDAWIAMGALSAHQAITSVEVKAKETDGVSLCLRMDTDGVLLKEGQPFELDTAWLSIGTSLNTLLQEHAALVAQHMAPRVKGHPLSGVCTWYELFTRVKEDDVRQATDMMARHKITLPVDMIQLDDGWQKDIGHWHNTNGKFGHSLRPMVQDIEEKGYTPGLWWAPFYTRPTAPLARQHPERLLKNKHGRPRGAGFNPLWGGRVLAWDPSHPQVLEMLEKWTRKMVEEWGFTFLKMDFLFAGFLPGKRHRTDETRLFSARKALELIRQTAGEKTTLLGCGMPLLPAVGIFDTMRVGPDTAPYWESPLMHAFSFGAEPSARWGLLTPLNRQHLHGQWWWNDPDCLLVRETNTQLSRTQSRTQLRTCVMTGGMRLMGDLPQRLGKTPLRWLSKAMGPWPLQTDLPGFDDTLFPRLVRNQLPQDTLGRQLLLLVNLETHEQEIKLPAGLFAEVGPLLCLDLDERQTRVIQSTEELNLTLASGAHRLLLVAPLPEKPCFFAGSWSDAAGLGEWAEETQSDERLTVRFTTNCRRKGLMHVYLPPGWSMDGGPAPLPQKGHTQRFALDFDAPFSITFDINSKPG